MDEVGNQMLSVEMSIENLIERFSQTEKEKKQLMEENKRLLDRQNLMEDQIRKLMERVQIALSKID